MSQQDEHNNPGESLEPEPMERRPFLQALSWFTGVVAGGVLISILVIRPSLSRGATRAGKAMWQLRHGQTPEAVSVAQTDDTNQDDGDVQQPTAP